MSLFKIIPLTAAFATEIRTNRKDLFGNDVVEQLAAGFGPCRVSLKPFVPQYDKRLLFSYSPFAIQNVFNQNGPIFISSENVEPYSDIYRFPPEIKADKINFPLSLIGYSIDQQMVFTQLVGEQDIDELIDQVLHNNPKIYYLHARNAEAQCFICKIERK